MATDALDRWADCEGCGKGCTWISLQHSDRTGKLICFACFVVEESELADETPADEGLNERATA